MLRKIFLVLISLCSGAFASYDYQKSHKKISSLIESVQNNQKSKADALLEVDEFDIEVLMKPSVATLGENKPFFSGVAVCSGAATGVVCFDAKDLEKDRKKFGSVVWVTNEINNDDLCYIKHADAICAINEDPSSHAIIVTRVNNIPCVTMIENAQLKNGFIQKGDQKIASGDRITIDAFNGKVYGSPQKIFTPKSKEFVETLLKWSDEISNISIHANADTNLEAEAGLNYGAQGVDPRSEHMFFHPHSLQVFRKVILREGNVLESLAELREIQRKDILKLMKVMGEYPVKIRLLDPPLHEFLPKSPEKLLSLSKNLNISVSILKETIKNLEEDNPMMGHRGVRLLLTFPEILENQIHAIFDAAYDEELRDINIKPVIVIPMVVDSSEVISLKNTISRIYESYEKKYKRSLPYKIGVMIETPRACLLADDIAKHVDYFSFGTNDLTGLTFAFSRGDVYKKFLGHYLSNKIVDTDPFSSLDKSVVQLMRISVARGRKSNKKLQIGICGEQASEKKGVFTCHQIGLNSISCSPHKIPAVKLFAAQAAILYPKS